MVRRGSCPTELRLTLALPLTVITLTMCCRGPFIKPRVTILRLLLTLFFWRVLLRCCPRPVGRKRPTKMGVVLWWRVFLVGWFLYRLKWRKIVRSRLVPFQLRCLVRLCPTLFALPGQTIPLGARYWVTGLIRPRPTSNVP